MSAMQVETLLPPGQAVFVTVFKVTPKARARGVAMAATRLQRQLEGLGHQHPRPYRKPILSTSRDGTIMLAIENVHFTQADADASSLGWAWQIAHQAGLSEQEWDAEVFESRQLTTHRELFTA
jgi:hypothetical protein